MTSEPVKSAKLYKWFLKIFAYSNVEYVILFVS
jgi:hypothetical protein